MPFKWLYSISDGLFFVTYHLVGYRKKVVLTNLTNSFPGKNEEEIKTIGKKFYRHLCDLIVETIKLRRMGKNDFAERMVIRNPETINAFFEKGQNVTLLTMHYNNWEWSSCLPMQLRHTILGVYKPLHNPVFDKYINENRSRMGAQLIQNAHILRTLIAARNRNKPVLAWLAADQTPPVFHKFWIRFMNQEAMFYPGPAYLSKKFNQPVFFQKIEKTARGKYATTFELLFENPAEKSETEIIKAYIRKMEQVIREQPEFYLWSHKRWKHKRPGDVPLHP